MFHYQRFKPNTAHQMSHITSLHGIYQFAKQQKITETTNFLTQYNHGKTKSATLQKRNVIFRSKNEMHKNYRKSHSLSGFFHLFKQCSNNIQKEQYIVKQFGTTLYLYIGNYSSCAH